MATGKQIVNIRRSAAPQDVVYTAYTQRNTDLYPLTSEGEAKFEAAASAGAFTLTVVGPDGTLYTIPAGTRPPLQPPYPSGTTATTSAIGLASRYTYSTGNGGSLQIRASGIGSFQLKIERVDGQAMALSNAQNTTLPTGTFLGSGQTEATDGYTLDWTLWGVPAVPIRVTFQSNGVPDPIVFTPVVSDNPKQLFTTSSVTNPPTTNPTTTTYRSFNRMLVVGNSFTKAGQVPTTDWFPKDANGNEEPRGMAAESLLADYVHKVWTTLKTVSPNLMLRAMGDYASFENGAGSYLNGFAFDSFATGIGHSQDGVIFGYEPVDLVLISGGENFDESQWNYNTFATEMDKLIAKIPKTSNCVIMFRNSVWSGHSASNAGQKQYAQSKGYMFVDFTDIVDKPDYENHHFTNQFIAKHWNDAGHAEIANRFLEKLKVTTTTPGTPTTGDVDAQGFLKYDDQGWIGDDQKTIENSEVVAGFRRQCGGQLMTLYSKSDNVNRINDQDDTYRDEPSDPRYNKPLKDKGIAKGWAPYFTPGPNPFGYTINGKSTDVGYKGHRYNTGCNIVQAGSLAPAFDEGVVYKSAIINHPTRGQVFCCRTRGRIWGVKGEEGHAYIDTEYSLEGIALVSKMRMIVFERTYFGQSVTEQRTYISCPQEMPCIYGDPDQYTQYIDVNGARIDIRKPKADSQPSNRYFSSKCYVGQYEGNGDGMGLTWYQPGVFGAPVNSGFNVMQKLAYSGPSTGGASSYMNAASQRNYDSVSSEAGGHYIEAGYLIIGTHQQAMSKIATLPQPTQDFNFDFTKDSHGWSNGDMKAKRENRLWVVYFGDPHVDNNVTSTSGKFTSPYGAWQASGIANIEITAAIAGMAKFKLVWEKPTPSGSQEFSKEFTITGDGSEQTRTFSTSDANWTGTICSITIQAITGQTTVYVGKMTVKRIRKV